jgi:hypothetical protein
MKRTPGLQRVAIGAVALLIAGFVAACGGGGNSTTTTTDNQQAAQDWANGLCTATNTYITSLTSLGDTLKGNPSKDGLDQAVDEAKSATETFGDDVKALGSPPVSDSTSKNALEDLQNELSKDADTIKSAMSDVSSVSDALKAVSTITATLATVGTQISSTYNEIKQADPKGTVQSAFQDAPACSSLIGS